MSRRAHLAYAETQFQTAVASARPIELVVMVYDRIFQHLHSAELAFEQNQRTDVAIAKVLELIMVGLQSCLNHEKGADISANLSDLYDWSKQQILLGKLNKDASRLAEVRKVLSPVAEAWRELAEQQSLAARSSSPLSNSDSGDIKLAAVA
jgi:flagellar protein FliS